MFEADQKEAPLGNQRFATTRWSVVLAGGAPESSGAPAALEELCRTYWYPLYAYVRRCGHSVDEAQDLTQEFFARLIGKQWLADADASKGRFRTFLLTALKRFLANEWRRSQASKRGGGYVVVSLDDTAEARYMREPVSNVTPEKVYERGWAVSVFERALSRLRDTYASAGKARIYDGLKKFLCSEPQEGEYAGLALELEMSTGAISAAVYRMRQHYRQLVREEIAQIVGDPSEVDDEMRWLLAAAT